MPVIELAVVVLGEGGSTAPAPGAGDDLRSAVISLALAERKSFVKDFSEVSKARAELSAVCRSPYEHMNTRGHGCEQCSSGVVADAA